MTRTSSRAIALVAVLLGLANLLPTRAEASVVVTVSIDGHQVAQFSGTPTNPSDTNQSSATFADLSYNGTDFTNITISASSNAPGSLKSGNLAQTSVNADGSTGSGVLTVDVVQQDAYTNPGSAGQSMILQSKVSNASADFGPTLTFQSYVGNSSGSRDFTSGLQTFDPNKAPNASPNTVVTSFVRGSSYYLENVLTLQAGGQGAIQVGGTETVMTPEPSTLVVASLGSVLLFGLRRRVLPRRSQA